MAALQEALKCLNATSWDNVPSTNPADLRTYIAEISASARLIIDSVPEPPPPDDTHTHTHGITQHEKHLHPTSAAQIRPSSARLNAKDEEIALLQREWGKPIKIAGARDNPLSIPVYKLPGTDGHGQWFARRSVHEGLPFSVWREKLAAEILETLRENEERVRRGRAPDYSVRGIGAERMVEDVEVLGEDAGEVMGRVSVFHVSAQFPRPTAPRDFVTMIINWEDKEQEENKGDGEAGRRGRSWMMVSRPCRHPDVPPGQGYIRGEYESVEFIREIVVDKGRRESQFDGIEQGEEATREELNPVEWIMVTRSDPGGNIPRWMVEKGTPRSICTDAVKFLDWACQRPHKASGRHHNGHLRESMDKSESSQPTTAEGDRSEEGTSDTDLTDLEEEEEEYDEEEEHHGLIASVAHLLSAGLERYAPQTVLDYMPHHLRRPSSQEVSGDMEGEDGLSTTDEAPRSISHSVPVSTGGHEAHDQEETRSQTSANSNLMVNLDVSPAEIIQKNKKGKLSSHEKQLAKLAQQKRSLEAQLQLVRTDIQSLHLRPSEEEAKRDKATALAAIDNASTDHSNISPSSSVQGLGSSEDQLANSNQPRDRSSHSPPRKNKKMHKVASGLFHEESKLLRQMNKIEKQQVKEAAKIEARERKDAERHEKSRSRTEAECLRREVEILKKECEKLKGERRKWLDLIGALQIENSRLRQSAEAEAK